MANICSISDDGVHFEDYVIQENARLHDIARSRDYHDAICALMNGSIVSLEEEARAGSRVRFLSPYKNE